MENISFDIEDEVNGFSIQGTIHPESEPSHRCEVWVYDSKERIARVRMVGQSMLHVIKAATTEAVNRLDKAMFISNEGKILLQNEYNAITSFSDGALKALADKYKITLEQLLYNITL